MQTLLEALKQKLKQKLKNHAIIKQLEKKTSFRLEDLLEKKLYIVMMGYHISHWGVRFSDKQIEKKWPLVNSLGLNITTERYAKSTENTYKELPLDGKFWELFYIQREQAKVAFDAALLVMYHMEHEKILHRDIYKVENHIEASTAKAEKAEQEIQTQQKSKAGSADKTRLWAKAIAEHLINSHPESEKKVLWEAIPESEKPATIDDDELGEFNYYRDGEKLHATLPALEKKPPQPITKSTFFKNYLKTGRENGN